MLSPGAFVVGDFVGEVSDEEIPTVGGTAATIVVLFMFNCSFFRYFRKLKDVIQFSSGNFVFPELVFLESTFMTVHGTINRR